MTWGSSRTSTLGRETVDNSVEVTMRDLVEYMAKALVEDPTQVRVREVVGETSVIYELSVASPDMGRIIGKQGRVANAMRTLLKAAATRQGKRAILEII